MRVDAKRTRRRRWTSPVLKPAYMYRLSFSFRQRLKVMSKSLIRLSTAQPFPPTRKRRPTLSDLPAADNTPEGLAAYLAANREFRQKPWPSPYDITTHTLRNGDARNLSWIPAESVHLVVTSPPYWTLKEYNHVNGQMGDIEQYELFLNELDKVWAECERVL